MERKLTHYRLYKAKKQWITACSVVIVGTGLAMANATVAHADTVADSNSGEKAQTTTTVQDAITQSKQVTLGGTSSVNDSGTVTATSASAETTGAIEKAAPVPQADTEDPATDETLQNAKAHAGQVVDDQSHNYHGFVNGQKQSVTVGNMTVKLDQDIFNNTNSAKLTVSGVTEAGETYTILIPKMYVNDRKSIEALPATLGDTSIFELKDADGHEYWEIIDKFANHATVEQTIPLVRNISVNLSDLFADSDKVNYYRAYDLITGKIKIIHGAEAQELTINYQLPMVFNGRNDQLFLEDIYDLRIANGSDINLSIPIGIESNANDLFGTIPIAIPDFSFNIQGPAGQNIADWIDLASNTGKITTDRGERSTFHVNLVPQGDNTIKVTITDVTPFVVTRWNVSDHLTATLPLNVHLPAGAFAAHAEVPIEVSDIIIPLKTGNTAFAANDTGIIFKVLQARDAFDAQIKYQEHQTYQNINAGQYTTDSGGFKPDSQPNQLQYFGGQRYDPGYNVSAFTNVSNKELKNIRYVLNIPDGLAVYSVIYGGGKLKNVPDSLTLTLSDGTVVRLTKDQLQGKWLVSLRHNISHDGYYIDSGASIRKVEATYSTVLGHSAFGVTSSAKNNGYRVEANYASGQPVENADKLHFTAQISSADPANKINSPELNLCEVYIKGFTQGVIQAVKTNQTSAKAGDEKAGSLAYQIADSASQAIRPNLEHPIAYIKVPTNAVVTDLSQITVKTGAATDPFGVTLTPKSISVVTVGDTNFIKVDLSNYDLLQKGFTITVPYGNAVDAEPGAEHSPFLVVADNLSNDDVQNVVHFSADADAKTNTAMRALIAHEGIDVNKTAYVGTHVDNNKSNPWQIAQAVGMTSSTMVSDNQSVGVKATGEQSLNHDNADKFKIYGSISNGTSHIVKGAVEIVNLPDTTDNKSQFTPVMTGPAKLVVISGNHPTALAVDAESADDIASSAQILYRLSPMVLTNAQSSFDPNDGSWLTAEQVSDWSKVKAVAVSLLGQEIPPYTSLRLVVPVKDAHVYDHVNQTIYVSSAIFSQGVAEGDGLPTLTIEPASRNSAKLTVVGHSTIKTLVHYQDAQGDHYVELTGHTKTYQDGTDTMKRSDFLQSDADLTAADKALLPEGLTIDYNHPRIQNSTAEYLDGYPNNEAEFDKLVKYDFDGDAVVFEASASSTLIPIEKTVQIKRTIHYQYADGRKAAADVVQTSKKFTIHGTRNPLTNEETWEASADSDNLTAVDSPIIAGYTPDKAKVAAVTVTPDSKDSEETVTYTAETNEQKLDVVFIDDTTGKTLKTVTKTGASDTAANYNTTSDIREYTDAHYELVSDSTQGADLVFDNDDAVDQHYEVHLKHSTSPASHQATVNETSNYVFANGGTAAESYHATPIVFTQTGTTDNVTGVTTWDPVASQTFARHESPVITGCTADIPVVEAQVVNFGDHDIVKTVTYTANEQKLAVTFIDDTTGQTLKTVTKIGASDTAANYNTASDIKSFTDAHYELVSDSTNGANLFFDHDEKVDQHYEVHLKHGTEATSDSVAKNLVVHYVYADNQAKTGKAADDAQERLIFTRTGTRDLVTNQVTWNAWDQTSQTFPTIISPIIKGYQADRKEVNNVAVTAASPATTEVTVKYYADQQTLTVDFIDDTTGQTLKTVTKTGASDSAAGYNTLADIKTFTDGHYVLVSDSTHGDDLFFDHDDSTDQHYEVHLKHGTSAASRQATVNETIHYVFVNGTTAADSYHATPIVFHQTGIKDDVTGAISWDPVASQTFARHESPVIAGYTADIPVVAAQVVNFGDPDIVKTVTYTANEQKLDVTFIDDTTGQVLQTVTKTGPSDTSADYNTASDISNYEHAHYALVSDNTNGLALVFDHDDVIDQHYTVHLKHQLESRMDTKIVRRVIHYTYTDGTPANADVVQVATFTQNGQYDQVTQETIWGAWTADQHFAQVVSPQIKGYTASQDVIAGMVVTPASADAEITVVYSKQPEEHHEQGQPDQPGQPGNPSQLQATPATPTKAEHKLPQTGNSDNHAALAAGLIGLAGWLTMFGLGKKRKQK